MAIIQDSYFVKYRYSLRGELGLLYILEPSGWNEDNKIFKRSPEVHGVFTNLSNNLEFYLGDKYSDGGYNYLRETYETKGINAKVSLVKEENVSGKFHEVYRGNFDFSTYDRTEKRISMKFNESGLYEKIKARNTEELEVDRLTTMEGSILPELKTETVALDGRKILIIDELNVTTSNSESTIGVVTDGSVKISKEVSYVTIKRPYAGIVIPLTMKAEQAGNVQTIYDYECPASDRSWGYGNASSTASMFYDESLNDKILTVDIDLDINLISHNHLYGNVHQFRVSIVKYGGTLGLEYISEEILISKISPVDNTNYKYEVNSKKINILTGESLSLVIRSHHNTDTSPLFSINKANIKIYDETYYEATQAKCVMPFEALDRIINIITDEPNKLKSKALGRTDIGYNSDGYASLNGLTNGFWARQFNTNKITTTFQDFIDSYKCVWQLGYGIEKIGFNEIVRLEHISHFYQEVVTIKLSKQIKNINRKCAKDYFYSSIEGGYSQPSGTVLYEEVLGLDEYNIKNSFTTAITRIKNTFSFVSKYRADSYGTEFARRKPKAIYPEEDTRYDLSVMMLDLKRGIGNIFQQRKWSDDFVVPEPFNKFTTGIYSPETATNLRLSPMNTLLRWGFWIKGGFVKNLTEYVRYSSSNGNSSLVTKKNEVGGVDRPENGNVLNSDLDKALYNPDIITFEYPIDYKTMKSLGSSTIVNGEEIMNYYGLVEFINEDGNYEYGFLLSAEPNGTGKIELLSSTKRISKVSSSIIDGQYKLKNPYNLGAVDVSTNPYNLTNNLNSDL